MGHQLCVAQPVVGARGLDATAGGHAGWSSWAHALDERARQQSARDPTSETRVPRVRMFVCESECVLVDVTRGGAIWRATVGGSVVAVAVWLRPVRTVLWDVVERSSLRVLYLWILVSVSVCASRLCCVAHGEPGTQVGHGHVAGTAQGPRSHVRTRRAARARGVGRVTLSALSFSVPERTSLYTLSSPNTLDVTPALSASPLRIVPIRARHRERWPASARWRQSALATPPHTGSRRCGYAAPHSSRRRTRITLTLAL